MFQSLVVSHQEDIYRRSKDEIFIFVKNSARSGCQITNALYDEWRNEWYKVATFDSKRIFVQ